MSKTVLIVDDSAFMRTMIKRTIEPYGYTIVGEASDGKDAVSKYKQLKPDIVTMDITMPNVDGITALKLIKEIDNTAKVIMCSSMGQQILVMESIRAGAREFVVKPFNSDKLIDALNKL